MPIHVRKVFFAQAVVRGHESVVLVGAVLIAFFAAAVGAGFSEMLAYVSNRQFDTSPWGHLAVILGVGSFLYRMRFRQLVTIALIIVGATLVFGATYGTDKDTISRVFVFIVGFWLVLRFFSEGPD